MRFVWATYSGIIVTVDSWKTAMVVDSGELEADFWFTDIGQLLGPWGLGNVYNTPGFNDDFDVYMLMKRKIAVFVSALTNIAQTYTD